MLEGFWSRSGGLTPPPYRKGERSGSKPERPSLRSRNEHSLIHEQRVAGGRGNPVGAAVEHLHRPHLPDRPFRLDDEVGSERVGRGGERAGASNRAVRRRRRAWDGHGERRIVSGAGVV